MKKQAISENGLVADLFTNGSGEPQKAILMLGGSEGGNSWSRIRQPIEYFVKNGYAVLTLAYFKAPGLPRSLQEIPLEYFEKAFAWLAAREGIIANHYAIIGGSKGVEAALVLGSRYPQVKTVIGFSPSSLVWQGIPARRFEINQNVRSSWAYQGKGLPFAAYPPNASKADLLLLRLRKMHEAALADPANLENAAIQVEKIQGAILLFSGKKDTMWPATTMGQMVMQRLKANDFQYDYEHLAYDTGHNGTLRNRNCWRKALAFLQKHL